MASKSFTAKSHKSCSPSYKIALHLEQAVCLCLDITLSCIEKPLQEAHFSKEGFISYDYAET